MNLMNGAKNEASDALRRYNVTMKQAPIVVFCALALAVGAATHFISESWWARGGGDAVLIAMGVIVLGLIVWERRLNSH